MKFADSAILRVEIMLAAFGLASTGPLAQAAPQFEDATAEAGVVYRQHVARIPPNCIIPVDEFSNSHP